MAKIQNLSYVKSKVVYQNGKQADIEKLIKDNKNYHVFPFVIESGAVLATQTGFKPNKTRLYNIPDLSQVFTGKEAIIAQWEDSQVITQPGVKTQYDIKNLDDLEEVARIISADQDLLEYFGKSNLFISENIDSSIKREFKFVNFMIKDTDKVIKGFIPVLENNEEDGVFIIDSEIENYTINQLRPHYETTNEYISLITNWEKKKIIKGWENDLLLEYKAGRYEKWTFVSENVGTIIKPTPGNEYTSMSIAKSYELLSTTELDVEDYLRLWMAPDLLPDFRNGGATGGDLPPKNLTNPQWLYVSSNEIYRDQVSGDFLYSKITLTSLGDILAESGMSLWQHVQMSAPGSGYAYPKIVNDKVELDKEYCEDTGVKYMSVDINAPAIVNNWYAFGRPVGREIKPYSAGKNYYKRLQPGRHLLHFSKEMPITDYLTTNSVPDTNLMVLPYAKTSTQKYWSEWNSQIKKQYDLGQKAEFESGISFDKFDSVKDDNGFNLPKITGTEGSQMPSYDQYALIKSSILNDKYTATMNGYSYINNSEVSFKKIGRDTYNSANIRKTTAPDSAGYFDNNGKPITGVSLPDFNNFNVFAFNWLKTIPMEVNESVPMNFSTLPGVGRLLGMIPYAGGFLNDLLEGLSPGIRLTKNPFAEFPLFQGFNGLASSKVIKFLHSVLTSGARDWIDLDVFRDNSSNQLASMIGANSTTYSDLVRLSDKSNHSVYDLEGKLLREEITDNQYLGQKVNDEWHLWEDRSYATHPGYEEGTDERWEQSYIIDYVSIRTLAKADITIKTYAENPNTNNIDEFNNYVAKFQLYSKFTNVMANWNTIMKLNYQYIKSDEETEFTFPQSITRPHTSGRPWDINGSTNDKILINNNYLDNKKRVGFHKIKFDLKTIVSDSGDPIIYTLEDVQKYYDSVSVLDNGKKISYYVHDRHNWSIDGSSKWTEETQDSKFTYASRFPKASVKDIISVPIGQELTDEYLAEKLFGKKGMYSKQRNLQKFQGKNAVNWYREENANWKYTINDFREHWRTGFINFNWEYYDSSLVDTFSRLETKTTYEPPGVESGEDPFYSGTCSMVSIGGWKYIPAEIYSYGGWKDFRKHWRTKEFCLKNSKLLWLPETRELVYVLGFALPYIYEEKDDHSTQVSYVGGTPSTGSCDQNRPVRETSAKVLEHEQTNLNPITDRDIYLHLEISDEQNTELTARLKTK